MLVILELWEICQREQQRGNRTSPREECVVVIKAGRGEPSEAFDLAGSSKLRAPAVLGHSLGHSTCLFVVSITL